MSELEPRETDALSLRASDADRHEAAEVLREAAGDGRLDLDELNERLELVYAAKTHGDLVPVLADLAPAAPTRPQTNAEPLVLETGSGSVKRMGHWIAPPHIVARCTSGSVKLDFTEAVCQASEITVEASAKSGSVVLIVPRGWEVHIESANVGSGNVLSKALDTPRPGAPVLRVHGTVRSGTVKVRYPYRSRKRN